MTGPDLRSFVARSRALVDATPPTTARETRAWLVEPFLETLGWTVRDDAVATDAVVEDARLEYVLGVDSVPALFVAVEPYGDDLEEGRARSLLEAMAWTGVDRAIYTNGLEYVLLAGTTNVDHLVCELPSLPDHASSIEGYSRAAATRRLERESPDAAARRLAVNRSTVVESIAERLTAVAGDAHADELEAAADRFLDRLVVSFAENESDRFDSVSEDVSLEFTDPTSSTESTGASSDAAAGNDARARRASGDAATDDSETTTDTIAGPDARSRSRSRSDDAHPGSGPGSESTSTDRDPNADGSGAADAANGDTVPSDRSGGRETNDGGADGGDNDKGDDGEYVARFFNERGSIGAIGHSGSERALVGVAEYLFERGLSGISVPWSPDDEVPTLLNDEPVRAAGDPMAAPRELSNGLYLETGGDVTTHAQVAQALAARAGLRVMLTGDWE